ncbi:MAG TPA: FmdB family zinc ribbon protein [Tepidisphaeraceae bacterium]|nr:FmdB family zinc ribbon protein [Tepidisphaeraceae bacterium]
MPTYEYKCEACGHEFEKFQSMTADRIRKCPKCGKMKLRRLVGSGAGLIFKGSGFYITDYRDKSYPKEESGKTESGKTAETKSDAAPVTTAAKSEATKPSTDATKPAKKSETAKTKPSKSKSE